MESRGIVTQQREFHLNHQRALVTEILSFNVRDPYVSYFKDDPVILELETKTSPIVWSYWGACCCFSLVLPCFIIHQWMVCSWCNMCCVIPQRIRAVAKATHVSLRERTLRFLLEDVQGPADPPGSFIAAGTHREGSHYHHLELVIPLDDALSFEMLNADSCAIPPQKYPLETLLILSNGLIVCAIDCPKNAQEFITRVKEQKSRAGIVVQTIPPNLVAEHRTLLNIVGNIQNMSRLVANKKHPKKLREQLENIRESFAPVTQVFEEDAKVAEVYTEPVSSKLLSLSVDDVVKLLQDLGLGAHTPAIKKSEVDGAMLSLADDDMLVELGISSSLERKKLLAWILKTKQ